MSVTGIGGLFFRADDPKALKDWYRIHLGIGAAGPCSWEQQAGTTLFMPFPRATDYFPADRQWMINFRVEDLDALISALRAAGITVTTNPDWDTPETGRFARLYDPEGNPVELWQPPAE